MTDSSTSSHPRLRLTLCIALLVQIGLVAIAASAVLAGNSRSLEFSRPAMLDEIELPIDAESGIPVAEAYASQWSGSARLISVSMRLDWRDIDSNLPDTELPGRGWIIYVFEVDETTLSVYLDRGTGILIGQNESVFGGESWPTLDLTTYPRSSSIAAITANITSGASYRTACPDFRTASIVTASTYKQPGKTGETVPVWTVTYGDSRNAGTFDVLVRLDAISGEVITNEVRERACAE